MAMAAEFPVGWPSPVGDCPLLSDSAPLLMAEKAAKRLHQAWLSTQVSNVHLRFHPP